MVQDTIEAMLRQKLGLDANSVGSRMIERAIEQRQIVCCIPNRTAYLRLLRSSPQEFNQLIEAVVVPETWFFRDKEPFEYLRLYVKEQSVKEKYVKEPSGKSQPAEIFRVLSLPCSTGEEPYSIAITLLEAGLKPNQFRVDAVDVSEQALLKAKQGVYRKKSFRGGALQNREQYFQSQVQLQSDGYAVRPIVRESVNFKQGNVLEPHFLVGRQYHAIFCRNLLIYLDKAARHQVIDALDRALLPLGVLFLGAAETGQVANRAYQAIDHPFAFAYQKMSVDAAVPAAASSLAFGASAPVDRLLQRDRESGKINRSSDRLLYPLAPQAASRPPKTDVKIEDPLRQFPAPVPAASTPLETAKQLADRGELMKAAHLCESHLRADPSDSIAYVLLGEIYQGLNQPHLAERCFQKAVYLNPNAYEALIHLALLKEQQGNRTEAERLKRRAQRLVDQADQGYEQSQSGS